MCYYGKYNDLIYDFEVCCLVECSIKLENLHEEKKNRKMVCINNDLMLSWEVIKKRAVKAVSSATNSSPLSRSGIA